ncbi:hypothetical protein AB9K34_05200 [Sedimentitalea sp. XS_ASV28]|uniref:hypothetical protein n=1 Tax=Sedimentitalea sp. XS_ASV28 TaxID=3241296 RepID=UPI00351790AB
MATFTKTEPEIGHPCNNATRIQHRGSGLVHEELRGDLQMLGQLVLYGADYACKMTA